MNASKVNCFTRPDGIMEFHEKCYDLQIVYFISGWHNYSLAAIVGFDIAMIIPASLLNLLIILAMIKDKPLQTASNLFLTSLAFSDMLTGILTQPLVVSSIIYVLRCIPVCWLFISAFQIGYFLAAVSFLTVTVVSLDRYTAIFHPFKYQQFTVEKKKIWQIILVTWVIPLSFVIISFATANMRMQQLLLAVIAPVSVITSVIVQTKTMAAVKKAKRRDQSVSVESGDPMESSEKRRRAKQGKATRNIMMILVTAIICYLPQSILTITRMLRKNKFAFQGIYDWTKTLVLLSSSLNPIIYCLNLTHVRTKVLAMICIKRTTMQHGVLPVSITMLRHSKAIYRDTTRFTENTQM